MKQPLQPGATIGIIGGGQLGRMMALSARQMGYRIAVLEPSADSPCGQVADVQIEKAYDDPEGAKLLADVSDLVTYEFENIDQETAAWIAQQCDFPQGDDLLKVTQHRLKEKQAVADLGISVVSHAAILSEEDIEAAAKKIGFPAVLKTCTGGYDGKGQAVVRHEAQLREVASEWVKNQELVLEAWIDFQCEVSVIVTRSTIGEIKTFPVAENIHRQNILYRSIVPARVTEELQSQAREMALTIAEGLQLIGTLAVEFFVGKDGTLYVNELAPRPHNSGHYTIEACETSQFEQHIRAVCGWPLGETRLHRPVVMENLLGEDLAPLLENRAKLKDIKLHLYGKAQAKEKRKMGHLTVMAETVEEALQKMDERS